ncbi:monovalent cation/H+ antiporter complex subunit F [Streptomyces odontomachi]|uniref:monovalent cation/H+ antiporter complex subunit F n=1 Tax=Streptomyces odontomachi TaxID=2944940 RepID=UPI00210F1EE0|nr:monovalent cation/H+ antiporter complex subunit F [Streptomyces sp. ODS25]
MNAWLLAAAFLVPGGLVPPLWLACRGPVEQRIAAMSLASTVMAAVFLLLTEGFGRPAYIDVALVLAVLAPVGTLVFARCVEGDD